MNKQNVVHAYNVMLFSHRKEQNYGTCNSVGDLWQHYAKWNKSDTKRMNTLWFHLYKVSRRQSHRDRKNSGCQAWGEEDGELMFNGCRVPVWDDENALEMDSGDNCTTLWMYLMLFNCTLKKVKMFSFMLCIFLP